MKYLSFVLAGAALASCGSVVNDENSSKVYNTFSDIYESHYAMDILKAYDAGLTKGYPDGTFKPFNNITRAEIVSLALDLLGVVNELSVTIPGGNATTNFSDVPNTHWASGKINFASQNGIVAGYPDGTFAPNNNVTHAEAVAILAKTVAYAKRRANISTEIEANYEQVLFRDLPQNHWAKNVINLMSGYCLIAHPTNFVGHEQDLILNSISPNLPAKREWVITSTLRAWQCLKNEISPDVERIVLNTTGGSCPNAIIEQSFEAPHISNVTEPFIGANEHWFRYPAQTTRYTYNLQPVLNGNATVNWTHRDNVTVTGNVKQQYASCDSDTWFSTDRYTRRVTIKNGTFKMVIKERNQLNHTRDYITSSKSKGAQFSILSTTYMTH